MQEFRPAHVVEEDAELARALAAGEEEAVRTLYERFGRLVHTVAMRILRDPDRAAEATQQTFVQAWRYGDRFEPGRDFAPWLGTIARRAAIDIARREGRRPADSLEGANEADAALVELPVSPERVEEIWAVRSAIDSLDTEEREIVRLQHLEGWTQTQIAEHLGVPVGTVKSRSFRAHRRLQNRLAHLREPIDDPGRSAGGER